MTRYPRRFERFSHWRRTGWLGRRDSNLCILNRNARRLSARGAGLELPHLELQVRVPHFLQSSLRPAAQIPLSHFSRSDLEMQRFESRRPGREDSNLCISTCPIGPTAFVPRRMPPHQRRTPSRRVHDLPVCARHVSGEARPTQIPDAEVRILPPQPASQSLTHTESGRARNATKWRRFVHKDLVSVSGNWRRTRDSSVCL